MTSDDQRHREIERGERWLREVCVEPEPPDADRIKLRVRVAVNEQWLREELDGGPSVDLKDRTMRRVREEVESANSRGSEPTFRTPAVRVLRFAGILGLAAAACLVVYLGTEGPWPRTPEPSLEYVNAFESFLEEDDLGESLAELAAELSELELAFDAPGAVGPQDDRFEDLFEDVDDLMYEGEADWSGVDWS